MLCKKLESSLYIKALYLLESREKSSQLGRSKCLELGFCLSQIHKS